MPERLTDRKIMSLKPTGDGSVFYFDSEVSGLAVRVYPSGVRSFVFDYRQNGKQQRVTIGRHPTWSVGKARAHAGKMRLRADVGENVAPGRGGRLAALAAEWREVVKVTRRPRTAHGYLRLLDRHILPAFGGHELRAIGRNDIEKWHGELAARLPTDSNRALATLSALLTWCTRAGKIAVNPARGVRRHPENSRHVYLGADEIVAVHALLDKDRERAPALALRMALLTGARIGEVLSSTGEQIDTAHRVWIKAAANTKQKKQHIVPLQDAAIAVAAELLRLGVPSYVTVRRVWYRTRATLGRKEVRVHDLRHSRASALARNGASLTAIGRVLGHVNPQTTSRYAHLIPDDLRALIERA